MRPDSRIQAKKPWLSAEVLPVALTVTKQGGGENDQ